MDSDDRTVVDLFQCGLSLTVWRVFIYLPPDIKHENDLSFVRYGWFSHLHRFIFWLAESAYLSSAISNFGIGKNRVLC